MLKINSLNINKLSNLTFIIISVLSLIINSHMVYSDAPFVLNATTSDLDSDGRIDAIIVTFSENVIDNGSYSLGTDINKGVSVENYDVIGLNYSHINKIIYYLIETDYDTNSTPNLFFNSTNYFDNITQSINLNTSNNNHYALDRSPPIFLNASIVSENKIILAFSEPLINETFNLINSSEFTASNITFLSGEVNLSFINLIIDDVNETSYSVSDFSYTPNSAIISDFNNNSLSSFSLKNIRDSQSPRIITAKTGDSSSYGFIDNIKLVFSEKIDFSTINNDELSNFLVNGYEITNACSTPDCANNDITSSENSNIFYLSLVEGIIGDTGKTPLLSYIQGEIKDLNGVSLSSFSNMAPIDNSPPGLVGVKTKNATSILLMFSEQINLSQLSTTHFSITSFYGNDLTNSSITSVQNEGYSNTATLSIVGPIKNTILGSNYVKLNNEGLIQDVFENPNLQQEHVWIDDGIINPPLSVNISVNNSNNSSYAKVGDEIIITLVTDEDVLTPNILIGNKNATLNSGIDYKHWHAKRILTEEDISGVVNFSINYKDFALNEAFEVTNSTDNLSILFDKTVPTLTLVSIMSNNTKNNSYAKINDEIILTFNLSESINKEPTVYINNNQMLTFRVNNTFFTASFLINDTINEGLVNFSIHFEDVAGNKGNTVLITTDNSSVMIDNNKPRVINVNTSNNNGSYGAGKKINFSIFFSEKIIIYGNATLSLSMGSFATYFYGNNSNEITFEYLIKQGDNFVNLSYSSINALNMTLGEILDSAGNLIINSLPEESNFTKNHFITIDTIIPEITYFTLSNMTLYKNDNLSYHCNATDNYDKNLTYMVTGVNTGFVGTFNATCIVTDLAGNSANKTVNYTIIELKNDTIKDELSIKTKQKTTSNTGIETFYLINTSNDENTSFSEFQNNYKLVLKLDEKNDYFTNISLILNQNTNNATVYVKKLDSKPDEIPEILLNGNESYLIYSFLELSHYDLNDSIINSANLTFKVEKKWLNDNNLSQSKLYLYRYHKEWKQIDAKLVKEDDETNYYESISEGLSIFAIIALTKNAVINKKVEEKKGLNKQSEKADVRQQTLITGYAVNTIKSIKLEKIWYYRIAVIILLIFIFSSAIIKWKNEIKTKNK